MTGRPTAALLAALLLAAATARSAAAVEQVSIWADFREVDLSGRSWTAAELQGKVVLLDFWASWCAPCLAEIPTLRQAAERFAGRGFVLLGVSMDRTGRRPLARFLRRHGVDWPQLHDGRGFGGPLARRFRVEAVPRNVLVDRSGRVVGVDLPAEVLLAALPALLAGASLEDSAPATASER